MRSAAGRPFPQAHIHQEKLLLRPVKCHHFGHAAVSQETDGPQPTLLLMKLTRKFLGSLQGEKPTLAYYETKAKTSPANVCNEWIPRLYK